MRGFSLISGGLLTSLLIVMAALSLVWVPYDYEAMDIPNRLAGMSGDHWFGTDQYGRDIFTLILVGSRTTLSVSLIAVFIGMSIGLPLGLLAAARNGTWLDEVLSRGNDTLFAFPSLVVAIIISALYGPGISNAVLAVGIFNIPVFARVARGNAIPLWSADYVSYARVSGKGNFRISFEHILPNILNLMMIQGLIQFSLAILAESGLSYIGLGAQPPTPSWGRMLADGQTMFGISPNIVIFPGLAIMLSVFGFNALGDGLMKSLEANNLKAGLLTGRVNGR